MLPLGAAQDSWGDFGEGQNRYLLRQVEIDLVHDKPRKNIYVWSKMGPLVVIGRIREDAETEARWENTRLKGAGGEFAYARIGLPEEMRGYMEGRAKYGREMMANLSPRQQAKINEDLQDFELSHEYLGRTGQGQAMLADMRLYGFDSLREGGYPSKVLVRTTVRETWASSFLTREALDESAKVFHEALSAFLAEDRQGPSRRAHRALRSLIEKGLAACTQMRPPVEGTDPEQASHLDSAAILRIDDAQSITTSWVVDRTRNATAGEAAKLAGNLYEIELSINELNVDGGTDGQSIIDWLDTAWKDIQDVWEVVAKGGMAEKEWSEKVYWGVVVSATYWTFASWTETMVLWAQGEAGATNFTRTIAAIDGRTEWKEVHRTTYAREGG